MVRMEIEGKLSWGTADHGRSVALKFGRNKFL